MTRRLMGSCSLLVVLLFSHVSGAAKAADPLELGIRSYEAGDFKTARSHLEKVVAEEKDNARATYYLGRIALELGELDDAIEKLERAVTLDDSTSEYHLRLGVAYSRKIQSVDLLTKAQIAPKMKLEFEKAVEIAPESIEARNALGQYYLNAPPMAGGSAEKAMEQGEAIKALDALQGHLFMARVFMQKKDHMAAEKEMRAALELDPGNADVRYQLGMLCQEMKKYDAAFEEFEKAIEIDPGNTSAMYQIARTAIFSDAKLDRGVECLNMYLQKEPREGQPSWAHAHWRLGMLFEKMGDKERAKKEYLAAIESDPNLKEAKEALDRL